MGLYPLVMSDLAKTDEIARSVLLELANESHPSINQQLIDNIRWIEQAGENQLVVGSQARILYANDVGRRKIALAMNDAIAALVKFHHQLYSDEITMMFLVQIALTEKLRISRTGLCLQQIWLYRTLSEIHLEAPPGLVYIMEVELDGVK